MNIDEYRALIKVKVKPKVKVKKRKYKQTRNNPDQLREVKCRIEVIEKEINYYYS